ncbi:unnamed protein product [Bursaphelenchus okinawaensis]|uniref:Protein kinase domain-containing protein n=1 Tax=Bursaphelenchus okinawaensis TaxID=465554 RepID=A0A811LK86_9BILA|nr:unnamed protein product [Bursaphelenchus okinawaensis]CAG9125258.1 unnamed protein product [Bursaphelenchus okinawaensis]
MEVDEPAVSGECSSDLAKFLLAAAARRKRREALCEKGLEDLAQQEGCSIAHLLNSVSKSQNASGFPSFSSSYSDNPSTSAHASSGGSLNSNYSSRPTQPLRSASGLDPQFQMPPARSEAPLPVKLDISPIKPVLPQVKRSGLKDVTKEKKGAVKAESSSSKSLIPPTPVSRKAELKPRLEVPSKAPNVTSKLIRVKDKTYMEKKLIGFGGSCKVYEAVDISNEDVRVAVKVVDLNCDSKLKTIYLNEVKILEELQGSDYIVKLISYQTIQDKLYVVMELGERSLATYIENVKTNRGLKPMFLRYHWEQMLLCVKTIHSKNIIHSDLKPANFLMVDGRLKLIDFGIAAKLEDKSESIIQPGGMGTPNYMSPEAVGFRFDNRSAFEITVKTDVWSLGCILYALIYGKTPFSDMKSNSMKIQAIKSAKIKFDDVNDPQLLDTLKRCLEKDPTKRASVQELLNHPYLDFSHKENAVDVTLMDDELQHYVNQINSSTPRTAMKLAREMRKGKKPSNV